MAEFNNSLGLGYLSEIPTLQNVTDAGNVTTNYIQVQSASTSSVIYNNQIGTFNSNVNSGIVLDSLGLISFANGTGDGILSFQNVLNSFVDFYLPNKPPSGSYTLATTDDIPAVTGFVPYTGANQNVNLGEYELKAGQLTLDTTPTGTSVVGTTQWNDATGVSETKLKGGNVVLKNGVDLVARVINKVTPNATLLRANYTAVRISGAQGQRLAVAYAQANNDNNSADTLGLVYEDIATNQEGFIMTMGQFEEINTTGSLQGETWSDGDVLYLSPTTAGRITNIKPTGLTGHIIVMGYVEYAHAIHGKIYVKIMNGWELDELHNVYINQATLANNDGLFYDSSDQLWKNETIASALGYTPFQLPSLTSGSVLFSNGTTIAQDNSNLFWDDTNNRLGIGTATPAYKLTVAGTIDAGTNLIGSGLWNQGIQPQGGTGEFRFVNSTGNGFFFTWVQNNGLERMRLSSNNNLLVGTATDAGFKLDVNGTARVLGNITVSTGGLGTNLLNANINSLTANQNNFTGAINLTNASNQPTGILISTALNNNATLNSLGISSTASISSGTQSFTNINLIPTLNFTGTYSGIVRGLFYNPTLTSITGVTLRAIETVAGNVLLGTTSGSVGIGANTSINASAIVDITSTTKGFLPPRMTNAQRLVIASPAVGLIVYCTDATEGLYENTSTGWVNLNSNKPLQVTPITLLVAGWTLVSGLYEYDYSNANITSASIVDVIPSNSTIAIVQAAGFLPSTLSTSGSVKLYANNLPTADIIVTFNIFN